MDRSLQDTRDQESVQGEGTSGGSQWLTPKGTSSNPIRSHAWERVVGSKKEYIKHDVWMGRTQVVGQQRIVMIADR